MFTWLLRAAHVQLLCSVHVEQLCSVQVQPLCAIHLQLFEGNGMHQLFWAVYIQLVCTVNVQLLRIIQNQLFYAFFSSWLLPLYKCTYMFLCNSGWSFPNVFIRYPSANLDLPYLLLLPREICHSPWSVPLKGGICWWAPPAHIAHLIVMSGINGRVHRVHNGGICLPTGPTLSTYKAPVIPSQSISRSLMFLPLFWTLFLTFILVQWKLFSYSWLYVSFHSEHCVLVTSCVEDDALYTCKVRHTFPLVLGWSYSSIINFILF